MAETTLGEATTAGPVQRTGRPSVVLDDIHVAYRVHEGQRPTLRRLVANRFRGQSYSEVRAIRGITLTAAPGDSVGVIGRNGSGKSTLLKTVAGLIPPYHGRVYVQETPVMLGVTAALQQELSGRRNVYLGGTAMGLSRRELDERFDSIVEFAGLDDFIDMPMRAYSSGMKSRLHFSIATAVEPEILLIDEALSVGDQEFKRRSGRRIRELLEQAGTVFIVSHSLGMIRELCSRAIWLDNGTVVAQGDPDAVVDAYLEETDVEPEEEAADPGPDHLP